VAEGKKQSLLEKARAKPTQARGAVRIDDDMIDLIYAWAQNEVTIGQVAHALNQKTSQHAWANVAQVLQHMVMTKLLVPDGWLKEK